MKGKKMLHKSLRKKAA